MLTAGATIVVLLCGMVGSSWAAGRIAVEIANDIWTVQPDGSGAVNITNSANVTERRPLWSPDGSRILFERLVNAVDARVEIWSMAPDGSDQKTMVIAPGQNVLDADWSRDGRQVVFWIQDAGEDGSIWVANTDGTGATKVVANLRVAQGNGGGIQWSPTEDAVIFMINSSASDGGIWVMRMDGTAGRAQILAVQQQLAFHPRWSPDGAFVAYEGCPPGVTSCPLPDQDVWVMRGTGADRARVVDTSFGAVAPSWSPDGARLAYVGRDSAVGTPTHLHVVNRDGSGDIVVPNLPANPSTPDWEPGLPAAIVPPAPASAPVPVPKSVVPVRVPVRVTGLRLSGAKFRAARRGASIGKTGMKVTYTLPAPGKVTFKVYRRATGRLARVCRIKNPPKRGKRCTRDAPLKGSFRHTGKTGRNTFRFTGRLAGKPLAQGTYTLAATGPAGPQQRARFRITRRR